MFVFSAHSLSGDLTATSSNGRATRSANFYDTVATKSVVLTMYGTAAKYGTPMLAARSIPACASA